MKHKVIASWEEKMQFQIEQPGGFLKADAEELVGGENKGLRPKSLMVSALLGCTGMDVVSLLKKMRAEVDRFELHVEAELTEEHPKFYKKVHVVYSFYGNDLKREKISKSVSLSVERYCGVFEMFRQFAEVSHEINFIDKN